MGQTLLNGNNQAQPKTVGIQILSNLDINAATSIIYLIADGNHPRRGGRTDFKTTTFNISHEDVKVRLFDWVDKNYHSQINCYLAFLGPGHLAQNPNHTPLHQSTADTLVTVPNFDLPNATMTIDSTQCPILVVATNCTKEEEKSIEQDAKANGFLYVGACQLGSSDTSVEKLYDLALNVTELMLRHKELNISSAAYRTALKACILSNELTLENYKALIESPRDAIGIAIKRGWQIDSNNPSVKLYHESQAFLNGACAGMLSQTQLVIPPEVAFRISFFLPNKAAYPVSLVNSAANQLARGEREKLPKPVIEEVNTKNNSTREADTENSLIRDIAQCRIC